MRKKRLLRAGPREGKWKGYRTEALKEAHPLIRIRDMLPAEVNMLHAEVNMLAKFHDQHFYVDQQHPLFLLQLVYY